MDAVPSPFEAGDIGQPRPGGKLVRRREECRKTFAVLGQISRMAGVGGAPAYGPGGKGFVSEQAGDRRENAPERFDAGGAKIGGV